MNGSVTRYESVVAKRPRQMRKTQGHPCLVGPLSARHWLSVGRSPSIPAHRHEPTSQGGDPREIDLPGNDVGKIYRMCPATTCRYEWKESLGALGGLDEAPPDKSAQICHGVTARNYDSRIAKHALLVGLEPAAVGSQGYPVVPHSIARLPSLVHASRTSEGAGKAPLWRAVVRRWEPLGGKWRDRARVEGSATHLDRLDGDAGEEHSLPTVWSVVVSQGGEDRVGQRTFGEAKTCRRMLLPCKTLKAAEPRRQIIDQAASRSLTHVYPTQRNRDLRLTVALEVSEAREAGDTPRDAEA